MKVLFSVHLGARQTLRIPSEELLAEVIQRFDSFSTQPGEGWFRGMPDPGWLIRIASDLPEEVIAAAVHLRQWFSQIGVGIEVAGLYFRVTAHTVPATLANQIRSVLPDGVPARWPPGTT